MDGSVSLGRAGRKRVMNIYRTHPDPGVQRRAHMVLLLSDGRSGSTIPSVFYGSSRTIDRGKKRFDDRGVDALLAERRGRRSPFGAWVVTMVIGWVTMRWPRDFGLVRRRWT